MHGVVEQALLGGLALGHVGDRADDADDLAVGPDHRPGLEAKPMVGAARGAQAEILDDAAAPLLDHGVERGAVAVDVERMKQLEPARGRALEGAALEPELLLDLGADEDLVAGDVPVEDDVAGAGERQRPALGVAHQPLRQDAAGEGVLHDREADQHHDQHEGRRSAPAARGRRRATPSR